MLSISKPLSAEHLRAYHKTEYSHAGHSYYAQNGQLPSWWSGSLASEIGLTGPVQQEPFNRLSEGQDPFTGEQLVAHRKGKAVDDGREVAHRAGWDFTFNAPKTISLTALVGGDEQVRRVHRFAVAEAMNWAEQRVQARFPGIPLTTGKWIVAQFEHDAARPVNGYPAPHLHTHCVVFNLTALDKDSQARSIDPRELFRLQGAITRVYQNELALRLRHLGYEMTRGTNQAPDIVGYTQEYLAAESQRHAQIQGEKTNRGVTGREAEETIAHQDREGKIDLTSDQLRELHRAHGEPYGNQAEHIITAARDRAALREYEQGPSAEKAVDFAIHKLTERESVIERDGGGHSTRSGILQEALTFGQGYLRLADVDREIDRRAHGDELELVRVGHYRPNAPGERYTTREMLAIERQMIELVVSRKDASAPINSSLSRDAFREAYSDRLNNNQMHLVWNLTSCPDQIFAVQGAAGSGKSTALRLAAEIARTNGYDVRGLAPTSGAVKELLWASGVSTETLQKHLRRSAVPSPLPRLYFLDESSLAGAKQVWRFLSGLRPEDRAVFVGDKRQYQSIEAGRAFAELQNAGMSTFRLDKIVRQRTPEMLAVARSLAAGKVPEALRLLGAAGSVHEVPRRGDRFDVIARAFAETPQNTLVVSPDNLSREEINAAIRAELRRTGQLGPDVYAANVLASRQELTSVDLKVVASYTFGDVVRFGHGKPQFGIRVGDYATVVDRDLSKNTLRLLLQDGRSISVNPERLDALSAYRRESRSFAAGDRVQLTAAWKEKGLANRDLGTLLSIKPNGNVVIRMDAAPGDEYGRLVRANLARMPHLDYGYSMTSYSAQGRTVDCVLAHVDTGDSRVRGMLDKTMLYVMGTRQRYDLQIFTDCAADLERALNWHEMKPTALSYEQQVAYRPKELAIA